MTRRCNIRFATHMCRSKSVAHLHARVCTRSIVHFPLLPTNARILNCIHVGLFTGSAMSEKMSRAKTHTVGPSIFECIYQNTLLIVVYFKPHQGQTVDTLDGASHYFTIRLCISLSKVFGLMIRYKSARTRELQR